MSKIKKIFNGFIDVVSHVLAFITMATLIFVSFIALIFVAAKAPEIHSYLLRHKVGEKVYKVTNDTHRGSGTGFAIKADSGTTYVITNDHVCEASSDGQHMILISKDGNSVRRRIIEKSGYSDLCIIEAPPGVEGLEMGSKPSIGQIIASVGHPNGYDLTLSRGEIIMQDTVAIPKGPISQILPDGSEKLAPPEFGGILEQNCNLPKNEIVVQEMNIMIMVIKIKQCVNVTYKAYITNMLIQPGSSGSPAVNFWGNVVGVVFATDSAGWASVVSYNDLRDLLKKY